MSRYFLPYRYVDADNYKQHGTIEITERLTDEQACLIADTLDQGEYFIPGQVGVDALPYSKSDTEADHPWHEFVAVTDLDTEGVVYEDHAGDYYNSGPFTPEELVAAFEKAFAEGWKDVSDADAIANVMADLIAKIAAYPTTDEVLDPIDNDDTRLEIWQEIQGDSPDTLDKLIREARAIRDGKVA